MSFLGCILKNQNSFNCLLIFGIITVQKRDDLVVVICGSSASFMVNKVINDKFGLHNRITVPIRLLPFNLYETELYLKSRKIHWDRYAYVQLYMAIGGIPHYLEKFNVAIVFQLQSTVCVFKRMGFL